MKVIPLFGSSTGYKSFVVSRQRRLNCYYENRKDQDKSKIVVYGTPGLQLASSFSLSPALPANTPYRGFFATGVTQPNGATIYLLASDQYYVVNSSGTQLQNTTWTNGTNPGFTGNACFTYSPTQALMVDGYANVLYTISNNTTSRVTFQSTAPYTCTYVTGYFVVEQPGSNVFWVSNFNDASTWGSLAFAHAANDSDSIVAVDALFGTLVIFMQTGMEFWQNQGLVPQPFAPILSAANNYGLAAVYSRAHIDQSIIFLAQSPEGGVQFVQLVNTYSPVVISDADIDELINSFSTVSDAEALVYQIGQHKFYQCTFPTVNRTLLFDCSTRIWSEVQTGTSAVPVRHQARFSASSNIGKVSVGNSFNTTIMAGSNTTHGGVYSAGYSSGLDPINTGIAFGSLSNPKDSNGHSIGGIYYTSSFYVKQSVLSIASASSLGQTYFEYLTVAGSTYFAASATYSYSGGYSVWQWPSSVAPLFPVSPGNNYSATIIYTTTTSTGNYVSYFCDYQNGNIYNLSENAYTDNGVPIVREIITRHVTSSFNRFRPSLIYLDMDTGVGLQTGQGSNPQMMLMYSKDNGRTWSGERRVSIGAVGQYLTRVLWRRFGSTRDATFRFRYSDPTKFVITDGAMKITERPPAEKMG